jgi:hypothetical protein
LSAPQPVANAVRPGAHEASSFGPASLIVGEIEFDDNSMSMASHLAKPPSPKKSGLPCASVKTK